MAFDDDIKRFNVMVQARSRAVFANVVSATAESIVNGSPVTGAPGQPVDTGNLRNSWQEEFLSPDIAEISTNVEYAQPVEDNVRGVHFKNHGPHSVALTIAGFDRIVANETAKLPSGSGGGAR